MRMPIDADYILVAGRNNFYLATVASRIL